MAKKKKSAIRTSSFEVSVKTKISGKQRQYTFRVPEKNIKSLIDTAKKFERLGRQALKGHAAYAKKDLSILKSELLKDRNISDARKKARLGLRNLKISIKKYLKLK